MTQSPYGANPFEAPRAPDPTRSGLTGAGSGTLDPIQALSGGWSATKRNFGPWLGISVVGFLITMVAAFTLIGLVVVGPVLLWGAIFFTLNAVDGEAAFGDLFAGFSRFGEALGGMLGYVFLSFVVSLPGSALSFANDFMTFTGQEPSSVLGALAPVTWLVWTFAVTIRFLYAPYYIVDQGFGPIECMKASWEATRDQKLNNVLLVLLFIPVFIVGVLALFVGLFPAIWTMYGALAAGYRQLTGRPATARSAF